MTPRKDPTDECVLLTQAQRLFGFRTLRQLIYYLDRYGENVRQWEYGKRRLVHVLDLAKALLSHDPRLTLHAATTLSADSSKSGNSLRQTERLRKKNLVLEQENARLLHRWAESHDAAKAIVKEADEFRRQNEHLKGFLKDHRLFSSWESSYMYAPYSPLTEGTESV